MTTHGPQHASVAFTSVPKATVTGAVGPATGPFRQTTDLRAAIINSIANSKNVNLRTAVPEKLPMVDRVIIPLGGVGTLTLTSEAFSKALTVDRSPDRSIAAPAARKLLTAEQMEQLTSIPSSWWLAEARANRIAHQRFGKYVRFDPQSILAEGEHLSAARQRQS